MRAKPAQKVGRKGPAITPKHARRARETAPKKIATVAVARDASGKYQKGSSGNVSGRPTIAHEIRELAGIHSAEALHTILEIMRDRKRDPSVRLVAAKAVLDRAVGKPMQPIAGGLNGNLVNITVASGTVVTAEDAASIYRELCRDPSLDISQYKLAAPAPAKAVEQRPAPIESDPLAPVEQSDSRAMWERLGVAK